MSPRRTEDNVRIREQQRENIATAARRVFARKGFVGTRISDIAAEAGTSHGLVHHYFGSKDALFTDLVVGLMDAAVSVPALAERQPGSARDRLRWYVEVSMHGMAQAPEVVLLIWHAQQAEVVPAAARDAVARQGAEGLAGIARLLAAAQNEGAVVPGDAQALAAHLTGFMQGLAAQAAHGAVPHGYPDAGLLLRAFLVDPT